jgi:transposase
MTRKVYPSDIGRKQFEPIRPLLELARRQTKPRTIDLYEAFCGVLYVLKSGCRWAMIPSDFPRWRTVYNYWQIWNEQKDGQPSVLEAVLKKLVGEARQSHGRSLSTTFLIIDAQSVKNTDTAKEKGDDAGKKVSGSKRHIAVDTNGLPHAIHVTTANVTDRAGAIAMTEQHKNSLCDVTNLLVDRGYTGEKCAGSIEDTLGATVEVVKRSELHTFKVLPKRWVVERSFGWLEKCHRLWKNCETKLSTSLQMTVLAFLALLLRRL